MVNVKRKVTNFEILFFYSNFGIQNLKMTYIKELKFSNWDFITNFGTLFASLLFFLIIGKFVLLLISLFSPFIFLSLLGIYVFGFLQTQHLLYCIRKSAVPALSLVLHNIGSIAQKVFSCFLHINRNFQFTDDGVLHTHLSYSKKQDGKCVLANKAPNVFGQYKNRPEQNCSGRPYFYSADNI